MKGNTAELQPNIRLIREIRVIRGEKCGVVSAEAVWSGIYPYAAGDWQLELQLQLAVAGNRYDKGQAQRFHNYTKAVLSCAWDAPAAHVYDGEAVSWNGRGLAIDAFALQLGAALRQDCGSRYPPPRGPPCG